MQRPNGTAGILPAHLPHEIRIGMRALTLTEDEDARGMQILNSGTDGSGHRGGLCRRCRLRCAHSGDERHRLSLQPSSTAELADLQAARIIVPSGRKGRGKGSKAPVSMKLAQAVRARLEPCAAGREPNEPLLMRWWHRQVGNDAKGNIAWERDGRRAWADGWQIEKPWAEVIKRVGLPENYTAYSLRHTAIVRRLKAGMVATMVASMHDTSLKMFGKTYTRFIVNASDEMQDLGMLI